MCVVSGAGSQFPPIPLDEKGAGAGGSVSSSTQRSQQTLSVEEKMARASRIHNWRYDQLVIPDSVQSARELIAEQGRRPPIPESCPKPIRQLIARCWLEDANQRPNFNQISIELELLEQSLDKIIRHKFPFR